MEGYNYVHRQKVVFRDLDALGHVNNAVYLTYLETARMAWYMEATGARTPAEFPLILAEITAGYKSPALLGEVLLIGLRVTEVKNSSFVVEGRIEEESTGRLVVISRAVLVHFDYGAGRPAPLTPTLREWLTRAMHDGMEKEGQAQ